MSVVPTYPTFAPISLEMADELHPFFDALTCGISEFSFAGLFLFRAHYAYEISRAGDESLVVRGKHDGHPLFLIPAALPDMAIVDELFSEGRYWKNISVEQVAAAGDELRKRGIIIEENRDNADYLYSRQDLANLSGKKFHKKKNLVNACRTSYAIELRPLDDEATADALAVLDKWNARQRNISDYEAAREALAHREALHLHGLVVYADGKAAAWSAGEYMQGGAMFAVHFEKGDEEYRGIYQLVNQELVRSLPETVSLINREQDLGDEGLRQAKMTYRPQGFVVKYDGRMSG